MGTGQVPPGTDQSPGSRTPSGSPRWPDWVVLVLIVVASLLVGVVVGVVSGSVGVGVTAAGATLDVLMQFVGWFRRK